jgi:uncharacterized surface anchored protein
MIVKPETTIQEILARLQDPRKGGTAINAVEIEADSTGLPRFGIFIYGKEAPQLSTMLLKYVDALASHLNADA